MAINRWLGTAETAIQVDTFTPATIEIDDVFTLTVSGLDGTIGSVEYTAVDTSATTVSGALIALWQAETDALFTGIIASGTATVILTADVAGVGFTVASSAVDGGGADTQTFIRVATTPNGGPQDWSDGNNWSEGTAPGAVASENTYVENSNTNIIYGLNQSAAANPLDSLHIVRTFTGAIGSNGATGLVGEYLQLQTVKAFIGEFFQSGTAAGSGRIKIDFGAAQEAEIINYFTAKSLDTNKPAFRMLADNALTVVKEIRRGSVGIASSTGETTTVGSITVSYDTSIATDSEVEIGAGVTVTDVDFIGGSSQMKCGATNVTSKGGTVVTSGTGAITTMVVDGGKVQPASNGTITTCTLESGEIDATISAESREIITLNHNGGILKHDPAILTITNYAPSSNVGRIQNRVSAV